MCELSYKQFGRFLVMKTVLKRKSPARLVENDNDALFLSGQTLLKAHCIKFMVHLVNENDDEIWFHCLSSFYKLFTGFQTILTDFSFVIFYLQSTSAGQELLDNVFKHLNLIETAYFGLRYIDNTGQTVIIFFIKNFHFSRRFAVFMTCRYVWFCCKNWK